MNPTTHTGIGSVLATRFAARRARMDCLLGELNNIAGAIEAISELVNPTGRLTTEECYELLDAHFCSAAKYLTGMAFETMLLSPAPVQGDCGASPQ